MINWKDENYIHYFYKITNLTNGRYYYGIHSLLKSDNKDPLKDGYWGSGIEITEDIKKLGKENFKKEVIKTFSTRKEVSDMEKSIVTLDEINKSECYNKIPGGDTYEESMLGRVVCRPKNNVDKIVILSKKDYYNNKDKYIPASHKEFFLNGPKKDKILKSKKNYIKTQKKDESDTFFSRVRYFVNKDTLEIKKFIGHDEPDKLYDIWYPRYFLDEINNKFITLEYFEDLYKNISNINKISKLIKVSRKNLELIRDFYKLKGLDLTKYQKGKKGHFGKIKGFIGKRFINNGIEELIIDEDNLDFYLEKGYIQGKLRKLNKQDIIDYYTKGNSIRKCAKKFSTTSNKIKEILEIDRSFEFKRYYNSEGNNIKLLVNNYYHEKLLSNGWIPGISKPLKSL